MPQADFSAWTPPSVCYSCSPLLAIHFSLSHSLSLLLSDQVFAQQLVEWSKLDAETRRKQINGKYFVFQGQKMSLA
jgi:hypothetical protein